MAVYVVMKSYKYNLDAASRYGELKVILDETSGPYVPAIRRALRDFGDKDYLILSGAYEAIGIAFAVAAEMNNNHVNILKWQAGDYFPIEINLNQRTHEGLPLPEPQAEREAERVSMSMLEQTGIDFEQDAEQEQVVTLGIPADGATARLAALAQRQVDLERSIKDKEAAIALDSAALHELRTKTLPDLMRELKITKLGLADGSELSFATQYFASIPSQTAIEKARGEERTKLMQRRAEAFEWFRSRGHGDLIKDEVSVSFGRGADEIASKLLAELAERGMDVSREETVHASTLKAFAREQAERGSALPADIFGALAGGLPVTEIKRPKGH